MKLSDISFAITSLLCFGLATSSDGSDAWRNLSPNVAFQSKIDTTSSSNLRDATDAAINRMLGYSASMPTYDIQDMNQEWDTHQLAWRFLGFYIDCNYDKNDFCTRLAMYAVYADPNYEGGGIGEYEYYDRSTGEYVCYNDDGCRAKMDCHSEDSQWKLLGIFKIDNVSGGDGWMEQLFKHQGVCVWGWDTYGFASDMRKSLPDGCKETGLTDSQGNALYYDIKPAEHANITLGLYTDNICSQEYSGRKNYNVFDIAGLKKSDLEAFNTALNAYKICQPCLAYDLKEDDFNCYDDAGYTNCNQCMKFAIKAKSFAASKQDFQTAMRQQGLMNITAKSTYVDSLEYAEQVGESLPVYLQGSIWFFVGSLAFFFLPGRFVHGDNKKSPLIDSKKYDDAASSSSTEGSSVDHGEYSRTDSRKSLLSNPSGLVVDCNPWTSKRSALAVPTNGAIIEDDRSDGESTEKDSSSDSDLSIT